MTKTKVAPFYLGHGVYLTLNGFVSRTMRLELLTAHVTYRHS